MEKNAETPILQSKVKFDGGHQEVEKFRQYLATITVCLGAVCSGTVIGWTSPVMEKLTNANSTSLHITQSQAGTVGSIMAIGALVSSLPAGFVADRFGRRLAIIAFAVPHALQWLVIANANSAFTLCLGRFIGGVGTGAMCVLCPMYIGEIAAPSMKGALGSLFQLFLVLGILMSSVVGPWVSWVTLSLISLVVPVVFVVAFSTMPETPVYLVKIGNVDLAEKVLHMFRGDRYNIASELKQIQMDIEESKSKKAGLKDLVASPANKKALISGLALMVFQQFSGINAVVFYTALIFKSAGSSLDPDTAAIIVMSIMLVMAYVAAMVIERAGRKFFLLLSSVGMMVCLTALGMYFQLQKHNVKAPGLGILPLGSLGFYIVAFSMGYGPVPWMIMSELFAPQIREIASGIAVMTNWLCVFLVTFCFQLMNTNLGGDVTFYIFAVIMANATVFVYFVVPETRGMMQSKLSG